MQWPVCGALALALAGASTACVPNLLPEDRADASGDEAICTPGHVEACECDDGTAGWHECLVDGMAYASCFCVEGDDTGEPGTPGEPRCGDGLIQEGEICDDGNLADGDGCESDCSADPGALVWVSGYDGGGGLDDCALDVALDKHGFVYAAGFDGHGGVSRAWVRKFTPSGAPLWTHYYIDEARGAHEAHAIAIAESGDVVVGGLDDATSLNTDGWVRRLSADEGEERWTVHFTGDGGYDDAVRGLASAPGDSVIVCGERAQEKDDSDAWIARLGSGGDELWAHEIPGAGGDDRATDCTLHAGQVLVVGNLTLPGEGARVWVERRALEDGEANWSFMADGGPSSVYFGDVGVTADAAGRTYVAGELVQESGEQYVWLARLDLASPDPLVWERVLDYTATGTRGMALRADAGGAVYLATARVGSSAVTGSDDILVHKLAPSGEAIWSEMYDGAARGDDRGYGLAVSPTGVFVAGVRTVEGNGLDMWIGKFAP